MDGSVTVKFAILKTRGHCIVACGITRCTAQVCGVIPLKMRVSSDTCASDQVLCSHRILEKRPWLSFR